MSEPGPDKYFVLVFPCGPIAPHWRRVPKDDLPSLYKIIGCEYVQAHPVYSNDEFVLYVDEEAMMKEPRIDNQWFSLANMFRDPQTAAECRVIGTAVLVALDADGEQVSLKLKTAQRWWVKKNVFLDRRRPPLAYSKVCPVEEAEDHENNRSVSDSDSDSNSDSDSDY